MPPIGLLLGDVDFSNLFLIIKEGTVAGPFETLEAAKEAGAVTLNYGIFILIKEINKAKEKEETLPTEPTTKEFPKCFSTISIKASRCPNCTSEI